MELLRLQRPRISEIAAAITPKRSCYVPFAKTLRLPASSTPSPPAIQRAARGRSQSAWGMRTETFLAPVDRVRGSRRELPDSEARNGLPRTPKPVNPRGQGGQHMSRLRRSIAVAATVAATAAIVVAYTPGASAANTRCPSGGTPPPGSVIRGGLEVDGLQCNPTGVTVYGGITVDGTGSGDFPIGYLSIDGSIVNGGIVLNGGGVDVGVDGFDSFNRTFNPTTINGGLRLNRAVFFTTADATVHGGVTM